MKIQTISKVVVMMTIPLLFSSCGALKSVTNLFHHKKQVVTTLVPVAKDSIQQRQFLTKVNDNAQYAKTITSKIKFNVGVGNQNITLTGNLRMKRDDVIQLQLMAFGFVEAGRLEFTKDYVLLIDRINKQFIKADYNKLTFLQQSGLNFYSLQALFWNELFQPGMNKVTDEALRNYSATLGGDDVVITLTRGSMKYKWLAYNKTALLNMANIAYADASGKTQLIWDYSAFQPMGSKMFPTEMKINFSTPKKGVNINMTLNNLENGTDWETRTQVSTKYKEVTVDEILRRFMTL